MNDFGRVVNCGAISTYNSVSPPVGPRPEWLIITKRLKLQGFIVSDYPTRFMEAIGQLTTWVLSGKLQYKVTTKNGFESIIDAFLGLFDGSNIGKMIVKL